MGCRKKRKKKRESQGPAIIILFWFFFPSHSLIPLMKSGQAEACSRRQQFHCTICASHIGWQGGEGSVGSTARRKERGRKIHDMKSRMGCSRGTSIPCDVLSAASACSSFSKVPVMHLPLQKKTPQKNTPDETCHRWDLTTSEISALMQVNKWARYSHKRSQVPTQNGGKLRAAWPLPALRMWCRHPDHVIREDGK